MSVTENRNLSPSDEKKHLPCIHELIPGEASMKCDESERVWCGYLDE